jgi:hypothetical protein
MLEQDGAWGVVCPQPSQEAAMDIMNRSVTPSWTTTGHQPWGARAVIQPKGC